ncbi:MAG: beta-N-acetylhexosaminidase [Betaproteobacteria bacterium]|nr:beta-N-acetylhexosaminidase [Betaproteobacteria bacterium]
MSGPFIIDLQGLVATAEELEILAHPWVGGVILFTRNFSDRDQLCGLTQQLRQVRRSDGVPLLISVDHEGGRVQRFREGFTALPAFGTLGMRLTEALADADGVPRTGAVEAALALARQAGQDLAFELKAVGVDFSYTPVLDLDYGRSAVIGNRSFGRLPQIVTLAATAVLQGLAQAGFRSCGKHFPGHGWAEADSHHALPVDDRPLDQILANDVWPYARLCSGPFDRALVQAVMPAHVVYSQVDAQPAGFSSRWIREILRGRIGFEGVVISDDLSMAGAAVYADVADRAQAAFEAGCDATLICNRPDLAIQALDAVPARMPGFLHDPLRRHLSLLMPRATSV